MTIFGQCYNLLNNKIGYLSADIICELRGTDNVQGKISEFIFAPNGGYCVYHPSNNLRNTLGFHNWGIFSDTSQF